MHWFFHSPYLNLLNIGYVLKFSVGSTWPCKKKNNNNPTFRSRFIIISFGMKITYYNYSLMSCPVSVKRSRFTLNPALPIGFLIDFNNWWGLDMVSWQKTKTKQKCLAVFTIIIWRNKNDLLLEITVSSGCRDREKKFFEQMND